MSRRNTESRRPMPFVVLSGGRRRIVLCAANYGRVDHIKTLPWCSRAIVANHADQSGTVPAGGGIFSICGSPPMKGAE